jgi:hypothetical protein
MNIGHAAKHRWLSYQTLHDATQAAAPLRTGLTAARVAVWAAALALCAARARAGCFAAAEALVAAAQRLSNSSGAQRAAALVRQVTRTCHSAGAPGAGCHIKRWNGCRCRCVLAHKLQPVAQ